MCLEEGRNELLIDKITIEYTDDIYVYDIITENHTFIVNNIAVHDDFPEIDKHSKESYTIYQILKLSLSNNESLEFNEDKKSIIGIVNYLYDKYSDQSIKITKSVYGNPNFNKIFTDEI